MIEPADEQVSLTQAAEKLGVHYMTAYRYVRNGRLPAEKAGAEWRVRRADLELLVAGPAAPTERRGSRAGHRSGLEARLVAGDEAGAWSTIDAAMASGATPDEILLSLLSPSLSSIGDRWEVGELTVADEHRASAVAQRLIGRLGPRFARRGRKRGEVIVGAVQGERHSIPSAILADLLRGERFEVVDLGADTPPESFVSTALAASRLVGIAISVTSSDNLDRVRPTVDAIGAALPDVAIIVGGAAVRTAEQAAELGSVAWTTDATSVVARFEEVTNT